VARNYLEKLGYQIIETNFRCHEGEIDIVAQHGEQLVFVEVRTRRGTEFGTPEESISPAKREKLIEVANAYIQSHTGLPSLWRIDVVAIKMGARGTSSQIELIENAVSGD
jgi:putative endonuclease